MSDYTSLSGNQWLERAQRVASEDFERHAQTVAIVSAITALTHEVAALRTALVSKQPNN